MSADDRRPPLMLALALAASRDLFLFKLPRPFCSISVRAELFGERVMVGECVSGEDRWTGVTGSETSCIGPGRAKSTESRLLPLRDSRRREERLSRLVPESAVVGVICR